MRPATSKISALAEAGIRGSSNSDSSATSLLITPSSPNPTSRRSWAQRPHRRPVAQDHRSRPSAEAASVPLVDQSDSAGSAMQPAEPRPDPPRSASASTTIATAPATCLPSSVSWNEHPCSRWSNRAPGSHDAQDASLTCVAEGRVRRRQGATCDPVLSGARVCVPMKPTTASRRRRPASSSSTLTPT